MIVAMPKKQPSDQQAHDRRHQERMRDKAAKKKPSPRKDADANQAAGRIAREATK
jgi:hypothetical protein